MEKEKQIFLYDEFYSLTLQATLQRSTTYTEKAKDWEKQKFRNSLRELLNQCSKEYINEINEKQHIANIIKISDELSNEYKNILVSSRFRIGSAQKALNLCLKYLWCLGEIETPPHCPFDYVVIKQLKDYRNVKWTRLDDIEIYKKMVDEAKALAGNEKLALWELGAYNAA